jgi:hypothetical protein
LGIAVAVGGIEVRSMKTARRKTRHGGVLLGLWLGLGSALAQDHWEVGSADLLGVTSGKGLLVAVDSEGGTRLSRDGVTWFRCGRVTDQPLRAVAHGQGKFVAVGDYGSVVTSPDGLAWEAQVSGTDVHLQGVAYGEGRFVVAGEIGRIRSSEDGMNWTRRLSGTGESLTAVSYLDGQFRAVGDLGEEFAGGLVKDAEAITGLEVGAEDLGNLDGELVGGKARMPFAQFREAAEEFIRRNRRSGWGDRCGRLGRATACGPDAEADERCEAGNAGHDEPRIDPPGRERKEVEVLDDVGAIHATRRRAA